MPGMKRASVRATCSTGLWLSLRTIPLQEPPRPLPGPPTRGSSIVSVTDERIKRAAQPYNCSYEQREVTAGARARPAVDDAHVRRALDGEGVERALSAQSGEGPDRPVGRVRPADADRLRPRRRARARRGRQGRRADLAPWRHGDVDGRH